MKDTSFSTGPSINCRGLLLDFSTPRVMGILNITPDSFYSDSRQHSAEAAVKKAGQMLKDGADILDIGGYSSRPNAKDISVQEELDRVVPVITAVHKAHPEAIISVDTFRGLVARESVAAGASIVNDISAGSIDESLLPAVAELGIPYVLMHMRGTPQNMTSHADYEDVVQSVMDHLTARIKELRQMGISDIIVDPGFGFAKGPTHGFSLLAHLEVFKTLNCPVLVGLSRKSMIWKTLGIGPEDALNGTTVLNTLAVQKGANILRVHDVSAAKEIVTLWGKLRDTES